MPLHPPAGPAISFPRPRRNGSAAAAQSRLLRGTLLLASLLLPACTFTPAPCFPREPLPLPAPVAAAYALPGPPQLLRCTGDDGGTGPLDGDLACGVETVHFHVLRAAGPGRPMVLLVPILAGGDELMRALALRFAAHGFRAAWCERAGPAMRAPQRGGDLQRLFERTVLHQRILLAWLRARPDFATPATYACGVSLGGMVTTVLAAVEPELRGAAICLAGADLPSIITDSAEVRIDRWRRWRRVEDGLAGTPLRDELRARLRADPLHYAAFVPTDRVLLVGTRFDDVVRPVHQQLLWEALGRPDRLQVPLGHYSAALAIDGIVSEIVRFFGRLPARPSVAALAAARPEPTPLRQP